MIVKVLDENGVWRMWDDISDLGYGHLEERRTTAEMEAFKRPEDMLVGEEAKESTSWGWIGFYYKRTDTDHIVYFNTKAYIMNNEGKTIEKTTVKKTGVTAALPHEIKINAV